MGRRGGEGVKCIAHLFLLISRDLLVILEEILFYSIVFLAITIEYHPEIHNVESNVIKALIGCESNLPERNYGETSPVLPVKPAQTSNGFNNCGIAA